MASIKVKFRPSEVAGLEGEIYYQIVHDRKVRQISTDYRLFPDEWDDKRSIVTLGRRPERKSQIHALRERLRRDIERLCSIDHKLETEIYIYTVDDILEEFFRYAHDYSLAGFMESIISQLKQNGKVRTSETYKATLSSFKKFLADYQTKAVGVSSDDIMLDCINQDIVEAYESWLLKRGLVPNTCSFYMRILRAVYNRAVDRDIIKDRSPFRHVYTGVDKTVKRALPLSVISKIKSMELYANPTLDYARDMFIMSFYLRGMSFVDMAYLKKSDLKNGYITYRRRKTGQLLIIKWTKDMQQVLDKYPENRSRYLLPVIKSPFVDERSTYRNMSYRINRDLKRIALALGLKMPLTLYVARHSWASGAKAKGVPVRVISEGMGHDSESTTQIYLASLDTSSVDKANSMILASL